MEFNIFDFQVDGNQRESVRQYRQLNLPMLNLYSISQIQEDDAQASGFTIMHVRAHSDAQEYYRKVRQNFVWFTTGHLRGALYHILPVALVYIFKLRGDRDYGSACALVRTLSVLNGGKPAVCHWLVHVHERGDGVGDCWVVTIKSIQGPAHLIPTGEIGSNFINNTVALNTFNTVNV